MKRQLILYLGLGLLAIFFAALALKATGLCLLIFKKKNSKSPCPR